jgi:hypothetical protein
LPDSRAVFDAGVWRLRVIFLLDPFWMLGFECSQVLPCLDLWFGIDQGGVICECLWVRRKLLLVGGFSYQAF